MREKIFLWKPALSWSGYREANSVLARPVAGELATGTSWPVSNCSRYKPYSFNPLSSKLVFMLCFRKPSCVNHVCEFRSLPLVEYIPYSWPKFSILWITDFILGSKVNLYVDDEQ